MIWEKSVSLEQLKLKNICAIERYSHVMHIGSTVRGRNKGRFRCGWMQ